MSPLRHLPTVLIAALTAVLAFIVAAGLAIGTAHAGEAPDQRIRGERVPGVGIQLTFGEQSCLVTRPGACRAWLGTTVGQLDRHRVPISFHGDFRGARLAGLRLVGVDFSGARLARADFRGADLRGADFTGADLRRATFTPRLKPIAQRSTTTRSTTKCQTVGDVDIYCDQAVLSGTRFYNADLRGVDFSHAVMEQVQMTDTLAQGANFTLVDLQRSVITRTTFDGAIFDSTLLRSASIGDSSFADARMYKTLFYGTLVTESDFTGADLTKANFKGSLLRGNDFSDAVFSATTCPDYTKTDTGCPQDG